MQAALHEVFVGRIDVVAERAAHCAGGAADGRANRCAFGHAAAANDRADSGSGTTDGGTLSAALEHLIIGFRNAGIFGHLDAFVNVTLRRGVTDVLQVRVRIQHRFLVGGAAGEQLLSTLSINPGLMLDAKSWKRICFKGGSEPGVINMTYMLQSQNGTWYALSGTWLTTNTVDEVKFAGLIERVIRLLAP